MKLSTLILLGIALTACGDDGPGLTDSGSGSGSGSATGETAGTGETESADGGSTTDGVPTDPTPILEREPMITHACEETRAMEQPAGAANGRRDALVALGGEYFVLGASEGLALSSIALDGTTGSEVVLEPEAFAFQSATSVVVDASIATIWTYTAGTSQALRYAVVDDALGTVVAPKDVGGVTGAYLTTAALLPAAAGELALLYAEADAGGETLLRFVPLDSSGDATTTPVDVAELGPMYGMVSASAAATPDGGYAVSYTVGGYGGSEVFFVILDADGTARFEPRRISRASGDGWFSDLGDARRRTVLPVGDRFWVAFTERWIDPDPDAMNGNVVVMLAVVDADGESESHRLQAPVDGKNNISPMLVELDGRVGILWTTGTIIWICGGCITDNDLELVLLDPDAIVPASNVVTQIHPQVNGIVLPVGEFVGADMLTVASLDFHALTLPASGALRCEPPV